MYKILGLGSLLFVLMGICAAFPVQAAAVSATTPYAATSTATSTQVQTPAVVEKRVREYFVDIPVMIEIARCESKFRQFTDAGSVFRGGAGAGMIGVFQFYEKYHTAASAALGLDLAALEGNIRYARHLYEQSGTTPWASCVPAVSAGMNATAQLRIELMTKLIGLLQELLKLKLAEQ
jgi:hypothetical protein